MPKILLVKTSSMGDVIHNLPAATDICRHVADARIDWVVEEGFAGIPALHPGVARVIPVAVRRWRKTPFSRAVVSEILAFGRRLRQESYDCVLDTQGLIKSALVARWARGERCGYAWGSAREPLASLFYDKRLAVPRNLHAVERNRLLAARTFGYEPAKRVDYGIRAPALELRWLPPRPYAVLLHATSRSDKEWAEPNWTGLARHLAAMGLASVLPWGGEGERDRSRRLAQGMGDAVVPPALALGEVAALLAGARVAVGVDTGITHLAAALNVPVVAIYCASEPALTGVYTGGPGRNLGGAHGPPPLAAVIAAVAEVTAHD